MKDVLGLFETVNNNLEVMLAMDPLASLIELGNSKADGQKGDRGQSRYYRPFYQSLFYFTNAHWAYRSDFWPKMTRPSMESVLLYIKLIYATVSKNSGK